MDLTIEQKLDMLMALPWSIISEQSLEGDRLLRVAQVPSAVGTGSTPKEVEADLWVSLRASLRAYLHFGDPIPLPGGTRLPWAGEAVDYLLAP